MKTPPLPTVTGAVQPPYLRQVLVDHSHQVLLVRVPHGGTPVSQSCCVATQPHVPLGLSPQSVGGGGPAHLQEGEDAGGGGGGLSSGRIRERRDEDVNAAPPRWPYPRRYPALVGLPTVAGWTP